MKMQTILVPIDFSASSRLALDHAAAFAAKLGGKIVVLHVVEPIPYAVPLAIGPVPDPTAIQISAELEQAAQTEIDQFLRDAPPLPFEVERRVLTGMPAEEIVRFAEKLPADLIVMGTHGRRGIARFLLGSVAGDVVRRAPCPVMTIRATSKVAAKQEERRV